MEKIVCKDCGKKFKTNEALEMHRASVHSNQKKVNSKAIRNWAIFSTVFLVLAFFVYSGIRASLEFCSLPAEEMNIVSHENNRIHIHPILAISLLGEEQVIPANVGIAEGVMRPVHTHDASGELHVEGPCDRDFVLGDFFKVWDKKFNERCILDYCNDANHSMKMFVNGVENFDFENLVLRDKDQIRIVYE